MGKTVLYDEKWFLFVIVGTFVEFQSDGELNISSDASIKRICLELNTLVALFLVSHPIA